MIVFGVSRSSILHSWALMSVSVLVLSLLTYPQEVDSTFEVVSKIVTKFLKKQNPLMYTTNDDGFKLADSYVPQKCGEHIESGREDRFENNADIGEFPFLVSIESSNQFNKTRKCTGTIISDTQILTSMKCIKSVNTKQTIRITSIRAGRLRFNKGFDLLKENPDYTTRSAPKGIHELGCCHGRSPFGYAVITFKRKIDFKLNPYTDRLDNINKICHRNGSASGGYERIPTSNLVTASWISDGNPCAKRFNITKEDCPKSFKGTEELCFKPDKGESQENLFEKLLEGAPLVHLDDKKQWRLLGLHSKPGDIWLDCENDEHKFPNANFLIFTSI